MAHLDLIPHAAPIAGIAGIAEPHQSAVATILLAARQGLFTAAEADLLIDRVRTHVTTFPMSNEDGRFPTVGAFTSGSLPISPDRTV
jgi:hypothetical protein